MHGARGGPWYDAGSTNYTYIEQNSCGVQQIDLQTMITDLGNNGGNSTAVVDNYIAINNPC
jgi:hypothetical protein